MQTIRNATMRWDSTRGVLYVDDNDTGCPVLRIYRLAPKTIRCKLELGQSIDLTGPFEHASYPKEKPQDPEWVKEYQCPQTTEHP